MKTNNISYRLVGDYNIPKGKPAKLYVLTVPKISTVPP